MGWQYPTQRAVKVWLPAAGTRKKDSSSSLDPSIWATLLPILWIGGRLQGWPKLVNHEWQSINTRLDICYAEFTISISEWDQLLDGEHDKNEPYESRYANTTIAWKLRVDNETRWWVDPIVEQVVVVEVSDEIQVPRALATRYLICWDPWQKKYGRSINVIYSLGSFPV